MLRPCEWFLVEGGLPLGVSCVHAMALVDALLDGDGGDRRPTRLRVSGGVPEWRAAQGLHTH